MKGSSLVQDDWKGEGCEGHKVRAAVKVTGSVTGSEDRLEKHRRAAQQFPRKGPSGRVARLGSSRPSSIGAASCPAVD